MQNDDVPFFMRKYADCVSSHMNLKADNTEARRSMREGELASMKAVRAARAELRREKKLSKSNKS